MQKTGIIFKNNFQKEKIKKNKLYSNINKIILELQREIKNKRNLLNILSKDFQFNFRYSQLKNYKKYKTIAILGMGGSILGTEAIHNFFFDKIKKDIYFFNDINEKKIVNFKKNKNLSKVLFIIVSKSGNTIETLSNTFSLNILKNNAKNIIIITEKKNNHLFNLAKKFNLFFIEHKSFIGGRFSVLSEVGIIPAYLMGVNISKLRSNLYNIFNKLNRKLLVSSSLKISKFLNSKKLNSIIFLNYSPELEKFLFWLQQLIAESLGKKNKGFLPVISNAPKDHHSLLQLYLDGPKDKIFYIFSSNSKSDVKIKLNEKNKKKNFLNHKSLKVVKNSQKQALIKVLEEKKIPFRVFKVNKINEENLGKLFAYFILEIIIVGKLSRINPFDQPAVEKVKVYTRRLLSRN